MKEVASQRPRAFSLTAFFCAFWGSAASCLDLSKRWRWSVRLRDVVVFALLPSLVGLYVIAASIFDYQLVQQFDDYWSRDVRLDTLFMGRVSAAQNLPRMLALERRLDPEKLDSGIIRLQFPPDLWNSWQGDPLALIGRWNNVTLVRDNSLSRVRVRSRGDNSVHRMTEKKSFTL